MFGKRSDSQISVSNEIEVPNLVGQPQNVAETMCEKKQLKLEVESEKASDKAAGTIIEQKTKAGKKVKEKYGDQGCNKFRTGKDHDPECRGNE